MSLIASRVVPEDAEFLHKIDAMYATAKDSMDNEDEDDIIMGDFVDELVLDDLLAEDKQEFKMVSDAVKNAEFEWCSKPGKPSRGRSKQRPRPKQRPKQRPKGTPRESLGNFVAHVCCPGSGLVKMVKRGQKAGVPGSPEHVPCLIITPALQCLSQHSEKSLITWRPRKAECQPLLLRCRRCLQCLSQHSENGLLYPMAPNISGSRTVLTGEGYGDLFNAQSVPRSLERLSTTRILVARTDRNGFSEFV